MIDQRMQLIQELHKPARKNFARRRVIVKGLDDLFQADLVEMIPYAKQNRGFKYILVVIDVFSKFVWAEPVKNKSSVEVTKAMKKIFSSIKQTPKNLQTDQGKEFYNKDFKALMKNFNINHYSTYSSMKASIVERVNRTLKSKMWREFSMQGNYKWLNLLPKVVERYNNTVHSTTNFKPIDVTRKNEQAILNSAFNDIKMSRLNNKYRIGDYVRISKHRKLFDKGYTTNWTNEIFKIRKVNYTNPTTYLLEDNEGQQVLGGFYELELQRVKYPDFHLVEKVLKRKGNMIYVKWLGYPSSQNSWIKKSELQK